MSLSPQYVSRPLGLINSMNRNHRIPRGHKGLPRAILTVLASMIVASPALGQISLPTITTSSPETRAISAAEAMQHVTRKEVMLEAAISFRDDRYPKDSMLKEVA